MAHCGPTPAHLVLFPYHSTLEITDFRVFQQPGERRTVVVILLNGQKIDVACDPATATAGEVFQASILFSSEKYTL